MSQFSCCCVMQTLNPVKFILQKLLSRRCSCSTFHSTWHSRTRQVPRISLSLAIYLAVYVLLWFEYYSVAQCDTPLCKICRLLGLCVWHFVVCFSFLELTPGSIDSKALKSRKDLSSFNAYSCSCHHLMPTT